MATVLDKLRSLINQVDDSGGCCPSCSPAFSTPDFPYLQVTMLDPPCTYAPTWPKYVKPLTLPTTKKVDCDPEDDYRYRFAHFYNYYNKDYHKTGKEFVPKLQRQRKVPPYGVTISGKCPISSTSPKMVGFKCADDGGCPTGFKPCLVDMCPPPCNCELSCWSATIMPCPPKRKTKCCK